MQDVDAPGGSGAPGDVARATGEQPRRSIWTTPKAAGLHVTLAVVVPAFLGLFWWQVQRVRQGNTLSWAYVFEWPFFTGYAVYLWWKLVHDQLDDPGTVRARPGWHRLLGVGTGTGTGTGTRPASPSKAGRAARSPAGANPGGLRAPQTPPYLADVTAGDPAAAGDPVAVDHASNHELDGVMEVDEVMEEEDEELAAYNRYLAELNASGRPKRW